jgi:hypothetical protein
MNATATLPALHPAHLEDLRRSGLSDETIAAARLYSARPQDLASLCGCQVPDGTSGLVIPYDEDGRYGRVKLFPPLRNPDGKEQKYGQPLGSHVRAYFPPSLAEALQDPSRSLLLTEGEKKALKLTQEGFPTIGLGGMWNFREKELPADALIPELEAVTWAGRIVYLVPDSDAWTNEHVLLAVFRFARLLETRGATVLVVKLSTLPGQTKTGADDFLVRNGSTAFRRLQENHVNLGHLAFRPFREQEKAKGRAAKASQPLPPELAGRRIHPTLHFEADGLATVGIVTVGPDGNPTTEIITSTRERFPTETITPALAARPFAYPDVVDRWRPEDVTRFLEKKDPPATFESAVAHTWDRLDSLLELGRDCETVTLATWAVASYFHPAFLAFPRLDLRGERHTGKSKTLSILGAVSFNGLFFVTPTPAVLFRLAEPLRPTFCLDEIEKLASDEKQEILAFLNSGYKAGARVPRCEGDAHVVKSYAVYSPVALAGIAGVNRVTEDRAITLVLARGKDPVKLNAEVDPTDYRFAEIRDVCFRLALLRWREVAAAVRTLALPDWLMGRERELWRPLLAVASLADGEAGNLGLVRDLLDLAREQGQDRAGLSDEAEALVSVLTEKLAGAGEIILHPGDLCDDVKAALRWKDPPRPETVGRWMKRLKIPKAPRGAGGVRYAVTEAVLSDIRARAGVGGEEPTLRANLHPPTP